MEWVRGETLGHGSFSTVSLAKPKKTSTNSPTLIAVKSCTASNFSSLINEKSVLEDLSNCPHIIKCFGSDFSFQNCEKTCNLLLEYASGGTLYDKIRRSSDRKLPEYEIRKFTRSLLKGLFHVHEKGYVHCDIKSQNILICSWEDCETAKIGDFGLAKKTGFKKEVERVEVRGTPMCMSPEIVISGDQEAPADIWAFGCLVVEMATGAPVWRLPANANVSQLLLKIGSGESPEISEELSFQGKDFLEKCFARNPKERWNAKMLLDHPFVTDFEDSKESLGVGNSFENCSFEVYLSSPKCPFDFPEWDGSSYENSSLHSSSFDMSTLVIDRLSELACDHVSDNWSVMDCWVTVR